jgi:uncharacterized protein YbaR (Trm112 family)
MNPALLELLVCPLTRTPLVWDEQAQELVSEAAGLAYPVREGVPVLLVDEARSLMRDQQSGAGVRSRPVANDTT